MGLLRARQNNGQIPYYTGLQIQTSGNNVPISIVWGANKIAPNCIWTGGFYGYYGYPEGTVGGGKGGGSGGSSGGQSWQYYTSWAFGLCEGPVNNLGTIWVGQNAKTAWAADIWAFFPGDQLQQPWVIWDTYWPGQALNYHGLCYIASYNYYLGSNANLPQFSIEVQGRLFNSSGTNGGDADPAQIIEDFLTSSQYGVGFPSPSIDASTLFSHQISSTVTITIASPAAVSWSGTVPANGTPIVFFTTGSLPAPLLPTTVYYVINAGTGTFQLAATTGGSPITTTGSQSGTHTGYTGDSSYQGYCRAIYMAMSPALTNQETANTILARWLKLTNTAAVWSGGKLKFIPYGDEIVGPTPNQFFPNGVVFTPNLTPIYSLSDDDFIHEEGKDPVEVTRIDPYACYNWQRIQVNQRISQYIPVTTTPNQPWVAWLDENSYVPSSIDVWDQNAIDLYGLRMASDIQANEICNPTMGQIAAQLILQRGLYIRNHYKFRLSFEYCLLEPMDLIAITDASIGLNNVAVRIMEIEEDDNGDLSITAEEFPIGVGTASQYVTQGNQSNPAGQNAIPARVNAPIIFEPPSSLTNGVPMVFIAVSGGVATTYLLAEDSSTGQHYVTQAYGGGALTLPASPVVTTLSFTCYVQAPATNARSVVRLNIFNGASLVGADFDLAHGTINRDAGVTAEMLAAAPGSNWQILRVSTNLAATGMLAVSINLETMTGSAFNLSYPGTSGVGLYIWGAAFGWANSDGSASENDTLLPAFTTAFGASVSASFGASPDTPEGTHAVADPNWGGANVWLSTDGNTYQLAGQALGPSRQGYLTATLNNSGGNPDTADTLSVSLLESGGKLASVTATEAAKGMSLCYIADTQPEFLSFQTAMLTGTNAYNITTLYRGLYGTSPSLHASGTPFVRVDSTIFQYALPANFIGVPIYVKLQSFNSFNTETGDLSECTVYTYTPTGRGSSAGPVTQTLLLGQNLNFGMVSSAVTISDQWGIVTDGYLIAKVDLGAGI